MIKRVTRFYWLKRVLPVIVSLLIPAASSASDFYYIIQTGSFRVFENAERQYESLKQKGAVVPDDLRIESVHDFFAVRSGSFKERADAVASHRVLSSAYPDAVIIRVSRKDENIDKQSQEAITPFSGRQGKGKTLLAAASGENQLVLEQTGTPETAADNIQGGPEKLLAEGRHDEALKAYRDLLSQAENDRQKAGIHKKIGDILVSRDELKKAAEEFLQALSHKEFFTEKERLQMAVYISWADRLDEAIAELKALLAENETNEEARIHLARCLSWSGRLDESLMEADRVLEKSPENKDAKLVKANALSWKGDVNAAVPLYEHLLEKEDNFDARLGLAYALLARGDRQAARQNSKRLKPIYPYQEKELKKLLEAVDASVRPSVELRYSHFNDTDENIVNRYSMKYVFRIGDWKADISYRHTDARDHSRDKRAEDFFLAVYSKTVGSLNLSGGIGITQTGRGNMTNFLTGKINAEMSIFNGAIGAGISREVLTDTAEIIENRIKITQAGLYILQKVTDRISLSGSYSYRDYSDSNSSHDLQFVAKYVVLPVNPKVAAGYKLRYLDFSDQKRNGYFDPDDFISHQVFASLYYEGRRYYVTLEPFVGHQSFRRYGEKSNDFVGGTYATLGLKISRDIVFEVNAEGGNYAMGSAGGWSYYQVGAGMKILF